MIQVSYAVLWQLLFLRQFTWNVEHYFLEKIKNINKYFKILSSDFVTDTLRVTFCRHLNNKKLKKKVGGEVGGGGVAHYITYNR